MDFVVVLTDRMAIEITAYIIQNRGERLQYMTETTH